MFIINDRLNLWKIHFAQMIDNKKKYISRCKSINQTNDGSHPDRLNDEYAQNNKPIIII